MNATALQVITTAAVQVAAAQGCSVEAAMEFAIRRAREANPELFARLATEVAA